MRRDHDLRIVRERQQGVHPAQQIDTRGDHGGRVDERRHGSRAFHRVCEPREKGYLRGLPGSGEEQEQARSRPGARTEGSEVAEDHRVLKGTGLGEDQEHGKQETDVAYPVVDERLLARARSSVALEPERDEPVRARPDAFPADEGEQEVAAEDEQQHREHEQVQVQEELGVVDVALHVPDRVQVDERADTR